MLHYDAAAHVYYVRGVRVPGVSELIRAGGLLGDGADFYTEHGQQRGSRIHKACLDHDLDSHYKLQDDTEQEMVLSYLAWCRKEQPVWSYLEQPEYSPTYGFAGCADRIGMRRGRAIVLDIKSGAKKGKPEPWHGVQLALYDLLYPFPLPRQRFALYLTTKGWPKVVEYSDRCDYDQAFRLLPSGGGLLL